MEKNVVVIPAEQVLKKAEKKARKIRVAAYCRVSTDEEKQIGSFENQIDYFTRLIKENKKYEFVNIYSDEGISGCNIRNRKGFKAMIEDCEAGKIDLIITKSISRFARNTQDSLVFTRKLRSMGIGIIFEKEGINTLESSGELLLTLFSCFAQEESRSISENTAWGIRSKFRQGIPHINANMLLGYEKNESGMLVINKEQAEIVRRIFRMYLEGFPLNAIASTLNKEKIPGVHGEAKWCAVTISRILQNEKYKGAILMQKTFTASYLTKRNVRNTGQLNQYYVEDNHSPIIPPEEWDAVQEEISRRKVFRDAHGLRGLSGGEHSPFYARLFCSSCGVKMQRIYNKGVKKPFWSCPVCRRKIDETAIRSGFCDAFNNIVTQREFLSKKWKEKERAGTPLERVRARQMAEITAGGTIPFEVPELTQAVLQKALVNEMGDLEFFFLSGDRVSVTDHISKR